MLNSSSFSPFETHTHRNRHHYQQEPAELMISRNDDGSCSRHLARLAFSWGKMVNFGTRSQSQKLELHFFFRFLIRRGKCGSNVKLRFHNKQRGVPPTWTVTRRAPFAFGSGNDRKVIALSVLVISVVLQCPRSSQTS